MTSFGIDRIRARLSPLRDALLAHPVYDRIDDIEALRTFMEHHAFAVWDFMSLLKALQRLVCCVDVPWIPPVDPAACRLVNEIVLGEESDEDGQGRYASHFDLYRRAMRQCGADLGPIDSLIDAIRGGRDLHAALGSAGIPETVRRFVRRTFEVIEGGETCAIASAFTFGREDLLPEVFHRIVEESSKAPEVALHVFRYYLDRHIVVDGGEHGPMASKLVERLCDDDPARWQQAEEAAVRALEARLALWDGVCNCLDGARMKTETA